MPTLGAVDLVEQAKQNNESGVNDLGKTGLIEVKNESKEILENPITEKNIETGENIPEELIRHILENSFNVKNPKFIKCVDGRTPEDDIKGIYMPGGTDGLLDLVLQLLTKYNIDINPNDVRNILVEVIGGEENYYYHSDDHNYDIPGACGCSHDNLVLNTDKHVASNIAPKYKEYIAQKRKENKSKMEVLKGEHKEQGVILVDLDGISITPLSKESSYFIYNQKEVQKILKEFIFNLNKNLDLDIDINNALIELDKEALSTFGILGGEAAHYRLKLNKDTGKFSLESDGTVQDVINNYYLGE